MLALTNDDNEAVQKIYRKEKLILEWNGYNIRQCGLKSALGQYGLK